MLEQKSCIDHVEITSSGAIQVRMALVVKNGEIKLTSRWHRALINPGCDVEAQMALVNAHLLQMEFPPISAAEITKICAQAAAAWTPEIIAQYREKVAGESA